MNENEMLLLALEAATKAGEEGFVETELALLEIAQALQWRSESAATSIEQPEVD